MSREHEAQTAFEGALLSRVEVLHDQTVVFEFTNGLVATIEGEKVRQLLMVSAEFHSPDAT